MQAKTGLLVLFLLVSTLAGCTEQLDSTNSEERNSEDTSNNSTVIDAELPVELSIQCEEDGGVWTLAEDRSGEYYCDVSEDKASDEPVMTQEDCERRGGTWHADRNHCETGSDDREDEREDDREDEPPMNQTDCERRGGNWTEAPDRPDVYYCHFDREDPNEPPINQTDCDRRGGNWTEAPDRPDAYYCHFDGEVPSEPPMNQTDCEKRGGNWTEAPDRPDAYYCHFDEGDRVDDSTNMTSETHDWFNWTMNGTHEAIMWISNDSLVWDHLIIDFINSSGNVTTPSQYHLGDPDHPNYEEKLSMNLSYWEDGWYTANITVYDYDEDTETSTVVEQGYWRFWVGHYCNQPDAVGCDD